MLDNEILRISIRGEIMESDSLRPVIAELKNLIEKDPYIYSLFHQMFDQIPGEPPFHNNPSGEPQIRDYESMLAALNLIIHLAPTFNRATLEVDEEMAYMFEWPMGTPAGNAIFHHPEVNAQLRRIHDEWAHFLTTSDSRYVLGSDKDTHWFGPAAKAAMPNFDLDFICDPTAPYHGFTSWDDFFTRQYRPGVRSVASPEDESVIINACEASPLRLANDIRAHDHFCLKGQPYSLEHMLAGDRLAPHFVGGTVYQAYLHSQSYHRWHSPVSGTIVKRYVVPGAYYAACLAEGFDPEGDTRSMAYITHVNTRAIIFIQADNIDIGLMCFLGVGMCEVGSCDITVFEGQRVKKGDQLGMFHFGGSTYCLLFRPGLDLAFDLHGETPGLEANDLPVNCQLATVARRS